MASGGVEERMKIESRPGVGARLYEVVLGIAAGFSMGWFAWVVTDRLVDGSSPPLWPFAGGGIAVIYSVIRWARRRRGEGGWVHALWIPVVIFAGLMALIVLALRAFS